MLRYVLCNYTANGVNIFLCVCIGSFVFYNKFELVSSSFYIYHGFVTIKGTLPPSKKLMNWHESDVARFRKSENEYLPNFIEKYSPVFKILDFYFCLLFGISAVPSDLILEVRRSRQMLRANSIYHHCFTKMLV